MEILIAFGIGIYLVAGGYIFFNGLDAILDEDENQFGALMVLSAPVWPAVAAGLLAWGIIYSFWWLCMAALGKK